MKKKEEQNAQNRKQKQNVDFLMRLCDCDVISDTPVVFRI